MSTMQRLFKKPGHRYLIVGATVYLFEIIVIVTAQRSGAGPVSAIALSYILGTLVSFFLQKILTFGDTRMHHRILVPQMVATILLVAWNFCFSVLLARVLAHHTPAIIARTIALAVTTIWNFYLYKTRIFKNDEALLNA